MDGNKLEKLQNKVFELIESHSKQQDNMLKLLESLYAKEYIKLNPNAKGVLVARYYLKERKASISDKPTFECISLEDKKRVAVLENKSNTRYNFVEIRRYVLSKNDIETN